METIPETDEQYYDNQTEPELVEKLRKKQAEEDAALYADQLALLEILEEESSDEHSKLIELAQEDPEGSPSTPLYATKDQKMPRYADEGLPIYRGELYPRSISAVVGALYSPASFFIIPQQFWITELQVMKNMQLSYRNLSIVDDVLTKIRDPSDVNVGTLVAVFVHGEWHRARVLQITPSSKYPFEVRLIDFGDKVQVPIADSRYLLNSCVGSYEPAVECQLVTCTNTGIQPRRGIVRNNWQQNQSRVFHNIVFDRQIMVNFLASTKNEYNETVWKVTISLDEQIGNPLLVKKFRYNGLEPPSESIQFAFHPGYLPGEIERVLDKASWGEMDKYDGVMNK